MRNNETNQPGNSAPQPSRSFAPIPVPDDEAPKPTYWQPPFKFIKPPPRPPAPSDRGSCKLDVSSSPPPQLPLFDVRCYGFTQDSSPDPRPAGPIPDFRFLVIRAIQRAGLSYRRQRLACDVIDAHLPGAIGNDAERQAKEVAAACIAATTPKYKTKKIAPPSSLNEGCPSSVNSPPSPPVPPRRRGRPPGSKKAKPINEAPLQVGSLTAPESDKRRSILSFGSSFNELPTPVSPTLVAYYQCRQKWLDREAAALVLREERKLDLREIGRLLGLTRERVRTLVAKGLYRRLKAIEPLYYRKSKRK